MTDQTVHRLGYSAMLLVALIAAAVSFVHIVDLALAYGQPPDAAYLLPVSIDGCVAACSLAMLRAARLDLDPPGLARAGLLSGVLATLACNVGFGVSQNIGHGPLRAIAGSALSGWPAYAFIICAELAVGMVRRVARKRAAPARQEPGGPPAPVRAAPVRSGSSQGGPGRTSRATPVPPEAAEAYRASVALGSPLSARRLAELHLGGNRHAASRLIAAASNGHTP